MPPLSLNPFDRKQPPCFDTTSAAILATAEGMIAKTHALCTDIVTRITADTATFENIVRPLANDENIRSAQENHLRFYASTHPSKELREASYAAADLFNNAEADFFSQPDLLHLIDRAMERARDGPESTQLEEQDIYFVTKLRQQFVAHGCGIMDSRSRDDFVAMKKRATELAKQCRKNMANETTGVWFTREELRGVPESFIDRLNTDEDINGGQIRLWVPTKTPFSNPVLEYASKGATRKRMYYAVKNRMPQNVSLHQELVLLRDACARLLVYQNHFAFKTSQKMIETAEAARSLLSQLQLALEPVAQRSADELLNLNKGLAARDHDLPNSDDTPLYLWDRSYLRTIQDGQAGVTDSNISEYFELDTTLEKMLTIYEGIFGVKLQPVDTPSSQRSLTWHEDVTMFSAWDVDAGPSPAFLGYAYFDFYPREGKFTHAGHYTLQKV